MKKFSFVIVVVLLLTVAITTNAMSWSNPTSKSLPNSKNNI